MQEAKSCVLTYMLYVGKTSTLGVSESLCTISVPLQILCPLIESLSLCEVCVSKAVGNAVSQSSRIEA